MRLSTLILPVRRWAENRAIWRRAEALGFHTAYVSDHLSWRSFRDRAWFGAVPTLAAVAECTERIRLGPMVASPNFRHPVPFAKELIGLDDISAGRITLGIGAGGTGFDATALGQEPWSAKERADRFAEFVPLLDRLLREPDVTQEGTHYSAHEVRTIPGCVQQPRLPFAVAAAGPRGLRLAARYGRAWVTYGDPNDAGGAPNGGAPTAIAGQLARLDAACAAVGRDPSDLDRVLLQGFTSERPLDSTDAFVDYAARHAELGITEIVLPWPVPDSPFDIDLDRFERIATEGLAQ